MEKQFLKIVAGCAFLGLLVFASCKKLDGIDELEVVNYDAEFAIPIFNAKASFQDILKDFDEDTHIEIGADDLITVYYRGDVTGRSSTDLFDTINSYNNLPFPILDSVYPLPFSLPNSVDVDFAILKTGFFEYGFADTIPGDLTMKVFLPEVTLDGVPFENTTTHTVPQDGLVVTSIGPFDLSGYTLEPINDTVKIHYEAYHHSTGTTDVVSIFFVRINTFEASYVEGYLGNDVYELERDTIVIDFFENWTRGDVYFADPKINIIVNNSFGFPVRSKTNVLDVFTVDGDILALESDYLDNIDIDYPSFNEIGESKATHFDFNKDNSNIDVILGAGPVAVDYDLDAVANPDNNTAIRGYVTDSSTFNVQVEVELPLYGTASGFEARDTFDVNFDSYEDITKAEFKVVSENGIPLNVGLQIFFADENGNVLDSLFTPHENILEAAPVDGNGLPTAVTEKITFTNFDGVRLENIKPAKKLYMEAYFSTVNNGGTFVKVLSEQHVEIRMGMKVGIGG